MLVIFDDDTDQKLSRQDNKQLSSVASSSSQQQVTTTASPAPHYGSSSSSSINKPKQNADTSLKCTTYDNKQGICISIEDCDSLKNEGADILRKSTCGFQDDGLPQVCCAIIVAATTELPTYTEIVTTNQATEESVSPTMSDIQPIVKNEPLFVDEKNATTVASNSTKTTRKKVPIKTKSNSDRKFLKECGSPFSTTLRIVGGQAAADNAWPWFALLMIERRGTRNPECGAALIDDRHILTAAHCVVEQPGNRALNNSKVIVRLGEKDLKVDNDHYDVDVEEIMPHPMYQSATFKNDIALLRLTKTVTIFLTPLNF